MGSIIDTSGNLRYDTVNIKYKFSPTVGPDTEVSHVVSWPITLRGSLTLSITSDFTFTTNDQHFEISDDANNNITIDGRGSVITISDVNNYGGLVISRSNKTVVQNLGVTSNDSVLENGRGWIGNGTLDPIRDYFVGFLGTVNNCYSTGDINSGGGGITGSGSGDFGTCNINNCYSTGKINPRAGGICGQLSIYPSTCNINNCYSTGIISGQNSGGIIGANQTSNTNPTVLIQNCYSTGIISGVNVADVANSRAGGISGSGATISYTIKNCYVCGAITNGNTSYFLGSNSDCTPQECSNSIDGLWSDSIASDITDDYTVGLVDTGVWKHVIDDKPWKLKVFFSSTRFVYNATKIGGTFVYENNIYPINTYEKAIKMGLLNDGNLDLTKLAKLDTKLRTQLISGITIINNAKSTTIVLLDSLNNILDYVDSFTVIAESGSIQSSDIDNNFLFIPETENIDDQISYNIPISWPVIISGTTSILLLGTLNFNDVNNYLIVNSDSSNNVLIQSNDLTKINIINIPNYGGLVYSRSINTVVQNIGINISGTTTLADHSGWIGRCNSLMDYSFLGKIQACYSIGPIVNNCGGIVGNYAGYEGVCFVDNCYTLGEISGSSSGGIVGPFAGINGVCNIYNCYSVGKISGIYSGGIAGQGAGISYSDNTVIDSVGKTGSCTITNCYSTGIISGGVNSFIDSKAGGIIGSVGTSGCTISNCYVSGNIENGNTSYFVGENSLAIINNCSNSIYGLWNDASASSTPAGVTNGLLVPESDSVWKQMAQNVPWKLKVFTSDVTIFFDEQNNSLTYTNNIFPINIYPNQTSTQLINNGTVLGNYTIGIDNSLLYDNVGAIYNSLPTSLVLVDTSNNVIDYIDVFTIYKVSDVLVSPSSMTLNVGEVGLIDVTINPPEALNTSFTLTSSDINVATVNDIDGVINIYSVSLGQTQIIATSVNGGLYSVCNVNVVQPATGISINKKSLTLVKGAIITLLATVSPNNATDKSVTWSSSNTKVATVKSSGKVTCVSAGVVIIKALSDTFTASCKITVTQPVISVSLTKKSLTILKGKKDSLKATIYPKNATDQRVIWSSSNTKVVKVTLNGVITAISPGTATIKVTTVSSKRTAICKVIVK